MMKRGYWFTMGIVTGVLLITFAIIGEDEKGRASVEESNLTSVEEGNLTSTQAPTTFPGPFNGDSVQIFAVTQFYTEDQWAPIEQAVSDGSDIVGIIPHNERIFVVLQSNQD